MRASSSRPLAAILVAYRDPVGAAAAVASLLTAVEPPEWIGVVDHSPAAEPLPALPAGVACVRDPANPGFAGGVNRLARMAPADADLLLLNPDAVVGRDTLLEFRRVATNTAVAAATVIIDHDPPVDDAWFAGGIVRPWLGEVRHLRRPRADGRTDFITGAALWIRREAWEQVGELDESLFLYAEDLDWCLRARAAGWQLRLLAGAQSRTGSDTHVRHRVSASVHASSGGSRAKTYYLARNTLRVLLRHFGAWRVLPLGLPRNLWTALRVPHPGAWLRGLWHGLRGVGGQAPEPDRG